MWVKHYKKKKSNARQIIKKMDKKEKMAKIRIGTAENKASGKRIRISPDKYFVLCNGKPIRSIEELALMLDKINDKEFSFHVNEQKNDFSSWIRDVFGKKDLADSLLSLKDKKESQIFLLKHSLSGRGGN
jgi:hypothetical protein